MEKMSLADEQPGRVREIGGRFWKRRKEWRAAHNK
jgi:hypothetical protein